MFHEPHLKVESEFKAEATQKAAMIQHIPVQQDCSDNENPLIDSTFQMPDEKTEKKRYYFGKFEHSMDEAITWWKKKATKRYEKLQDQDRLRTELEIWKPGVDLEIIR